MRLITAPKAGWPAIGPLLVLAGGLCWGQCQALDQGAAFSVRLMLDSPNVCITRLFASSAGLALATCQASSFQLRAIHPSWTQTTLSDTAPLGWAQTVLEMGLLGSSLKHWALIQADWAWKSNQLSREVSYYELRVDY